MLDDDRLTAQVNGVDYRLTLIFYHCLSHQSDQDEQPCPQPLHRLRRTTSQHLLRPLRSGLFSAGFLRVCFGCLPDSRRVIGVRFHPSLRAHVPEGMAGVQAIQERRQETSGN